MQYMYVAVCLETSPLERSSRQEYRSDKYGSLMSVTDKNLTKIRKPYLKQAWRAPHQSQV